MRKGFTSVCLMITLMAVPLTATSSEVITTSKGVVEFIGLAKWTPEMIEQKLGYKSADELHYCAADLKKIGFPEAAVIGYSENGKRYSVVTVLEPGYTHDVAFLPAPHQPINLPDSWRTLSSVVHQPDYLQGGVLDYARTLPGARFDQPPLSDGTPQPWWPALRQLARPSDYASARRMLKTAADPSTRTVAALVLMNFSTQDGAWRDLVRGLRDPDATVRSTCMQALNSFATFVPRKVDWAPAVPDVVAVLKGTNLFAFSFVLKALVATGVNSSLARSLLAHGNARLVLGYLNAEHPNEHDLAHRFLVQLSRTDLGNDAGPWREWIANLGSPSKKNN